MAEKTVKKIPLSQIVIPERQRCQPHGNIPQLAESIRVAGQLQPGIVEKIEDEKHSLVAGYGRFLACQVLAIDFEAVVIEGLNDITREEAELFENIHRSDLHWADKLKAEKKIFDLRNSEQGQKLTQQKFADAAGLSQSTISTDLQIAEFFVELPELADMPTKDAALRYMKSVESELLQAELRQRVRDKSTEERISVAPDTSELTPITTSSEDALITLERKRVALGDLRTVIKKFPDDHFDLVNADPPYGIAITELKRLSDERRKVDLDTYGEDSPETYFELMEDVVPELYRVMAPESHLWLWFAIQNYEVIKRMCEDAGFIVDPIPYIWYKINSSGQTNQPEFLAGRVVEFIFFCRKGFLQLAQQGKPNVFAVKPLPPDDKIHLAEKPPQLCNELISRSAFPGMKFLDAFAGSGAFLDEGKKMGLDYFGCEIDETNWEQIVNRLANIF